VRIFYIQYSIHSNLKQPKKDLSKWTSCAHDVFGHSFLFRFPGSSAVENSYIPRNITQRESLHDTESGLGLENSTAFLAVNNVVFGFMIGLCYGRTVERLMK
jgi:hypothetical protein